jgi:hypothetical protein
LVGQLLEGPGWPVLGPWRRSMTQLRILQIFFVITLMLAALPVAHADSLYTFDSDTIGASTSFSNTSNGLTATFSSSADPGGFGVRATFFSTLTGNVLADGLFPGDDNLALTIAFSGDATSISMDFATNSHSNPDPFMLTAFENSTQVGQVSAFGVVPPGFGFPEGVVTFNSATFNSVVLSSSAPDFAIDNVDVTPTPEPASMTLLCSGLLFLGMFARRYRSS